MNGDWKKSIPLNLPITPGHEIAGHIEEIGNSVPQQGLAGQRLSEELPKYMQWRFLGVGAAECALTVKVVMNNLLLCKLAWDNDQWWFCRVYGC